MPVETNLAHIAARISENLADSTAQTTDTILTELMRHTASSYSRHALLLQALQTLDENFLQNPDVANDTKTLISTKLMEDIASCTPGFHNRVQKLLLTQGVAANFSDMLRAVRQDIVERTAINNLHHTSDGNQVHAHNDFYTVASQIYNIPAINADDPHRGSLSDQQIRTKLEAAFNANYDLFGCLIQLEERLRSDLNTLGEYRGELNGQYLENGELNAYGVGSYTAFVEQLNRILEPSTPYTPDQVLIISEETGAITDIHWSWVRKKLYERLLNEHDFILNPEGRDFIRCFFQDTVNDTYTWLTTLTISDFDFTQAFESLHHLKALNFFMDWSWEQHVLWIHTYLENLAEHEINLKRLELFSTLNNPGLLDLLPIAYDLPLFLQTDFHQHDGESNQTIIVHTLLQNNPEKFNFVMDKLKLLSPDEQAQVIHATLVAFNEIAHKLSNYPAALSIFQLVSEDILLYAAGPILQLAVQHSEQALDCVLNIFDTLPDDVKSQALARQNRQGYNALILAAQRGYYQSIPKLLARGCDIESPDSRGSTALHWAAYNGHVEAVRSLINHGANLEAQGHGHTTALHFAVIHGQRAAVELLLEKGADMNVRDYLGENALDLAITRVQPELIAPLLMHLATLSLSTQRACLSNTPNGGYPHVLAYAKAHHPELFVALCEKIETHHHMSPQAFLLSASTAKNDLMASIQAMRDYGARLNGEGASKGHVACALAGALHAKVDAFFTNTASQPDFSIFKAEFLTLLHSEDTTMSEYRLSWPTIIKNIAIALTGIGLVCIAGQLIYSQATQGRPLFFFQQDRTTCDEKRDDIEQSMVMVEREARSAIP